MNEPRVKVLYYTPGNMQGVARIMQQLRKIYGNGIVALPKNILELDKAGISLNALIGIRDMLTNLIEKKQSECTSKEDSDNASKD